MYLVLTALADARWDLEQRYVDLAGDIAVFQELNMARWQALQYGGEYTPEKQARDAARIVRLAMRAAMLKQEFHRLCDGIRAVHVEVEAVRN